MRFYNLLELAPSNSNGWAEVYRALESINAGHITVWDVTAGETLGVLALKTGAIMATVVVERDGISLESGGRLWKPTLPLVDIAPLKFLDNRGKV